MIESSHSLQFHARKESSTHLEAVRTAACQVPNLLHEWKLPLLAIHVLQYHVITVINYVAQRMRTGHAMLQSWHTILGIIYGGPIGILNVHLVY